MRTLIGSIVASAMAPTHPNPTSDSETCSDPTRALTSESVDLNRSEIQAIRSRQLAESHIYACDEPIGDGQKTNYPELADASERRGTQGAT